MPENNMEKIVNLCKRRGIILPGSDIYGGLANSWDFGPLGVELKNNIKQLWWKNFVQLRSDMVGMDAAIIMNPKVWEASGHVKNFVDQLVECKENHERFRWDHYLEGKFGEVKVKELDGKKIYLCPNDGGELTEPRNFNIMFETHIGAIEDDSSKVYLRGETAPGMFVNFKAVQASSRKKLPFGMAQIGKAFRNEITPGNFIFRTREFEQMEIEYYIKESEWENTFEAWLREMKKWNALIGLSDKNLVYHEIEEKDRAFYSKRTIDVEYMFPFGQSELYGLAYRTDYDLKAHMDYSGKDLTYFDEETKEKYLPHVIEPSFGVERTLLAVLCESYKEYPNGRSSGDEKGEAGSEGGNEKVESEIVLHLPYQLAPIKAAILPLMKKDGLAEKGREVYESLKSSFMCDYDESGSIGKRYRRNDEVGTPYCITIDYDTLKDGTVTLRDRDTMKQKRVKIDELADLIGKALK